MVPLCVEEQFQALQCLQDDGCQVVNERVPRAVVRWRQCEGAGGAFDPKIAIREGAQEGSFVESLIDCVPQFDVRDLQRFVLCHLTRRLNRKGGPPKSPRWCRVRQVI